MGFLPLAIVVWMAAMLGWYVISKYFKSSDADKIKQRLMGVGKAARQKAKEAKSGEQSVIHTQQGGNKFAQLLVEKYQLGPKMQLFLEQAGLKWTPARLIHLCTVLNVILRESRRPGKGSRQVGLSANSHRDTPGVARPR